MTNVYVKLPVISLPVLVNAENKNLPLNEWIKTPYGTFRFVPNPRYKRTPELTLFGDTTHLSAMVYPYCTRKSSIQFIPKSRGISTK